MSRAHDEIAVTDNSDGRWVFMFLLIAAVALMAYGTFVGNPFETYDNASTL